MDRGRHREARAEEGVVWHGLAITFEGGPSSAKTIQTEADITIIIIIIIINRRSGITSHTSHGHKTGTRSMQPVRSVPLGGPVVS